MSVGDVIDSNAVVNLTDIYLNLPLVPLGATLQHPNDKSKIAPIDPIPGMILDILH